MAWECVKMDGMLCLALCLAPSFQASQVEKKPEVAVKPVAKLPTEYDAGKIEFYIRQAAQEQGFVGLEMVVIRNGKPSLGFGFGKSLAKELKNAKDLTPDEPLAIGSVSKQFTCAALLLLAQDGKLAPTDKVSRWYPDLTNANTVTLLDLMNHTSGYTDYYPLDFVDRRLAKPILPDDLIRQYAIGKVDFEPGAKYSYSNTGYTILGRVIEKVSGKPLGVFLRERLFLPVGMTTASFEPETDGLIMDGARAQGYRALGIDGSELAPPEGRGWLNGAGGVWASANDLGKWAMALMEGKLLDAKHLELMTKPRLLNNGKKSNYGCGLTVREVNGEVVWGHTGSISGFHANLTMVPRTKTVVVTLANAEHLDDGKLHREVVGLAQKEPSSIPTVNGLKPVEQAKILVAELTKGEIEAKNLGEEYKVFMTPERQGAYSRKLKELGEPKSVQVASQHERGGMEVSMLRLVFKDGTVLLGSLYRKPDGTVEQFLLTRE
jgi:CubicO group peptidase (beta-lactamase class C family)